jgi:hypothetical protein
VTTYKGIAAATRVLSHIAGTALDESVPGVPVTIATPGPDDGEGRLNIVLVEVGVQPNAPGHSLSLRYLLSFFGPHPQAALAAGAVESALHEHPVVTPTDIEVALANEPELEGSQLESQASLVKITRDSGSPAELWRGLFDVPYALSTLYSMSPIVMSPS